MDIQQIIIKSIYGTLTADEQQVLDKWCSEENHKALYDRIANNLNSEEDAIAFLNSIDVEGAWQKVKARSSEDVKQNHSTFNSPLSTFHFPLSTSFTRIAAAACVIGILAFGAWWYTDYTKVTPPVLSENVQKAMQQYEAQNESSQQLSPIIQQPTSVTKKSLSTYTLTAEVAEELLEGKNITTRNSKEYWMKLDDGSVVHINGNTRIIYPEHFNSRQRDVIIDGEACFMVAKDKSRPFIVHTPNGDVKVHGTEFNVNTRVTSSNGTSCTEVVLIHGSVGVTPQGGNETMITPGEKAVITTSTAVSEVDLAPYIAWNEGKFFFKEWQLSRIMDVIGKWYGKQVVFNDEAAKSVLFSGNFDKYDSIDPVIDAIESTTGLTIKVTDTEITISK